MSRPWVGSVRQRVSSDQSVAQRLALALLRAYKLLLSPLFTGACRFHPSCSTYMAEAVRMHGVAEGGMARRPPTGPLPSSWARLALIPYRLGRTDRSWKSAFFSLSLLSFLVLTAYRAFLPAPAETGRRHGRDGEGRLPRHRRRGCRAAGAGACAANTAAPSTETTPVLPVDATVAEAAEREIVVTTESRQGRVQQPRRRAEDWTLLQYADHEGKPADLVPAGLPPTMPQPFSLRLADPQRKARGEHALCIRPRRPTPWMRASSRRRSRSTMPTSRDSVRKTFVIDPKSYVITFTAEVTDGGKSVNPVLQWGPGLGDTIHIAGQNRSFGTYLQFSQAIVYADGKVHRLPQSGVASQPTWQGDFPFAGIDDHYFLASLVRPGVARITYQAVTAPMPDQPTLQREMMAFEALLAKPPKDLRVFFGPKDFDVLRAVDARSRTRRSTTASSRSSRCRCCTP